MTPEIYTRRQILQVGGTLATGGFLTLLDPRSSVSSVPASTNQAGQQAAPPSDRVAEMRAQASKTPLKTQPLGDNILMLYGPGGNMVALNGPDGKVLVDSSYSPVVPEILQAIRQMGNPPLKLLINTHWHIDHTDGNAGLHEAGATILSHENTLKRMSTPQDMKFFGLHFDPAPVDALPQLTFNDSMAVHFNGDDIQLSYVSPAHTDSDIFVYFPKHDVLHLGDIWFNGFYPLIDRGTCGSINGMVAGAEKGIRLATPTTKIIPGHGPLGDKGRLVQYRDMLATIRDRVAKQKQAGKSLDEVTIAKPTADFDPVWGNGFIKPDVFVMLIYSTL